MRVRGEDGELYFLPGRYKSQESVRHMLDRVRLCKLGLGFTFADDGYLILWHGNKIRAYVYERDGVCCLWCQQPLQRRGDITLPDGARPSRADYAVRQNRASLDHLRPTSRGGDNSPYNLVTACADCNGQRRNVDWRVMAQYVGREREIKATVEALQYQTYGDLAAGALGPVLRYYALELYRRALGPVWGAPVDPDPGCLPDFIYAHDADLWGVGTRSNRHMSR